MDSKKLQAYELIQEKELNGIKAKGTLLRHKKSGARIVLIENDDDNKVFSIAFRTPPEYGTAAYSGTFSALRIKGIPCKGSVCGAGERIIKYVFKCDDLSGQDRVPDCKLQ